MNRRESLAALFALGLSSGSLRAARDGVPRIGYLSFHSIAEHPSRERQAFLDGLRDFGLIPSQSVEMVYGSAENEPIFMRPMCEELLRKKVDVLATVGAIATLAALRTTRTVPIVFLAMGDPVGIGVSDSLARPTRNATGTTFIANELAGKRIELLKLAVPTVKRVAFLWDPRNRNAQIETDSARAAAEKVGIIPEAIPVATQAELNSVFVRIAARPHDALYASFATGVIADNRTSIVEFGLRHRIPVISGWGFMTEAGGLFSYAPDVLAMFRRSAYYVYRILNGANPADLPIERATSVKLLVNLGTARRLGLTLPPGLLLRADRLIE